MVESTLVAAMYDSALDLFTSDQVQWLDMDNMLHHCLFLRELADCKEKLPQAGLHQIFINACALQAYEMQGCQKLGFCPSYRTFRTFKYNLYGGTDIYKIQFIRIIH